MERERAPSIRIRIRVLVRIRIRVRVAILRDSSRRGFVVRVKRRNPSSTAGAITRRAD